MYSKGSGNGQSGSQFSASVVPSEDEALDSVELGVLAEVELCSVVLEGLSVLSVVVDGASEEADCVELSFVPELLQSTLDGQSHTSSSGLK